MNTATRIGPPPSVYANRSFVRALLPLLAAGLLAPAASAQSTSAVPGLIAYQGKVTNASGAVVGAGTPVNRLVIFRIWSHASNSTLADLLYSEQQTVTIAEGEFSTLIGQGTPVTGTPLGYSEASKGPPGITVATPIVFGGDTRHLGVTIDDGTTAPDPEVSPRQQLVTSTYAFRAKYAESLGSASSNPVTVTDAGLLAIGTPSNTLDSRLNVYSSGTNTAQFVASGIGPNISHIHHGATGDIYWRSASSNGKVILQDNGGNVGIGTSNPGATLEVAGVLRLGGTNVPAAALQLLASNSNSSFAASISLASPAFLPSLAATAGDTVFRTENGGKLHLQGGTGNAALSLVDSKVGIGGNQDPQAPLSFKADTGQKISLYPVSSTTNYGIGVAAGLLQIHTDAPGNDIAFGYGSSAAFNENVRIKGNGNVGIGTTSPSAKLDVNGAIKSTSLAFDTTVGQKIWLYPASTNVNIGIGYVPNLLQIHTHNADADIAFGYGSSATSTSLTRTMTIKGNGNVGIGTADPQAGLHITSFKSTAKQYWAAFGGTAAAQYNSVQTSTLNWGLICDTALMGIAYFYSDARLKTITGRSAGGADLALLQQIKVTDYIYKDTITNGSRPAKKVIAQELEGIFPQAVSHGTGAVPDIYQKAACAGGWVALATDLKVGERVRLIDEGAEGVHEVLETQPGRFRTAFTPRTEQVFVYGREVKDLRTVDYDAIAMLNVSATQELIRRNDALTARVAELEAKDRARDAKLASIEKLLQSSQTVMAAPAKPTTSHNGQE